MLREKPRSSSSATQTRSRLLVVPSVFRGFDHLAMASSIAARLPGLQVLDADAGLPDGDPATSRRSFVALDRAEPPPSRWLFYTSGTTAAPKGAQHTDVGLIGRVATFVRTCSCSPDDRVARCHRSRTSVAYCTSVSALTTGSRIVITEVFDPATTPEQMSRRGHPRRFGRAVHPGLPAPTARTA